MVFYCHYLKKWITVSTKFSSFIETYALLVGFPEIRTVIHPRCNGCWSINMTGKLHPPHPEIILKTVLYRLQQPGLPEPG
jgi:hypothetical protein